MHAHPGVVRQEAHGVGRLAAALGVHCVARQRRRARYVHPRQLAAPPHAGLVAVQHRRLAQRRRQFRLHRRQRRRDACWIQRTSVPRPSRTPTRSRSSCCTRPSGTSCSSTRYTASARSCGPSCARLGASAGRVPTRTCLSSADSAPAAPGAPSPAAAPAAFPAPAAARAPPPSPRRARPGTPADRSADARPPRRASPPGAASPRGGPAARRLLATRLPQALRPPLQPVARGRLAAVVAVFGRAGFQFLHPSTNRHRKPGGRSEPWRT